MELYAKPIITTSDDGVINIEVRPITPEYIDTRLAELEVFEQIKYNIEEVVSTVKNSPSQKQASKRLRSMLGIGLVEADFLLDLTIEEMAYYFNKENCKAEIGRWEALKAIVAVQ